jgi:sugar phosphate isomerase/epimerase
MIKALHSISTMHCNVKTEVRIAKETGYDAMEVMASKVHRYVDSGGEPEAMLPVFEEYGIWPICFNALCNVEVVEPEKKKKMLAEARKLCEIAKIWRCPTMQVCPLCALEGRPWKEIRDLTAQNLKEIADIGKLNGVRFQVELIAYSPIHTLAQALEVIDRTGRDNVGLVIDFWHLYAGGGTTPHEVAKLDKSMIYGVHFCDGTARVKVTAANELEVRSYRPGEGDIPVQEWVDAVLATGYDGSWSPELCSPKLWEEDLWEVARMCREDIEKYLKV